MLSVIEENKTLNHIVLSTNISKHELSLHISHFKDLLISVDVTGVNFLYDFLPAVEMDVSMNFG